jgi:hypothetical protein
VEKLKKRAAGWKGKLISRGGKIILADMVLSAIPGYYMSCFRIPIWVIKRLDKVRRDFLWGKK